LAVILAARRMRFDFIGLAERDVDTPTIRFPAGDAGRVVLVGISDALVIFFFVFVFVCIRVWIAPSPEIFDVGLALFVCLKFL
jgi:hypothetical protein